LTKEGLFSTEEPSLGLEEPSIGSNDLCKETQDLQTTFKKQR